MSSPPFFVSAGVSQAAVVDDGPTCRRSKSKPTVSESNLDKIKAGPARAKIHWTAIPGVRFRGRLLRMVPTVRSRQSEP